MKDMKDMKAMKTKARQLRQSRHIETSIDVRKEKLSARNKKDKKNSNAPEYSVRRNLNE